MIYEFFGLPGSGKTHLAEKFARECNLPLVEVRDRAQIYFWAAVFACMHPRTFFFFLNKMAKGNGQDIVTAFFLGTLFKYKIRNLYLRAIAKEGKAFFKKSAIVDEGLSQVLLYLYEREIGKEELVSFPRFFQGRTIYVINASADTRKKRMQNRGRTPREFLNRTYKGSWLTIGYESLKKYNESWFSVLEHNSEIITAWIRENFSHKEIHNE